MAARFARLQHGNRWTPEEDAELRRRCEARQYLNEIAAVLGRSQESVRTRANVLHVPCRSAPSRALATKADG